MIDQTKRGLFNLTNYCKPLLVWIILNKTLHMVHTKSFLLMLFVLILYSCNSNSETDKKYDANDKLSNVKKEIKEIDIKEKEISIFGTPYILNDYLIISDYKSPDKLIHIFHKNTFDYITSIGDRGEGPNEITNMGSIIPNKKENSFFLIDYGKQKILSYSIDSILSNASYVPCEKTAINNYEFPSRFEYINDTLSFALFIKRLEDGDYKPVVSKWNMQTGDCTFMDYMGHPDLKKKRVSFSVSFKDGIYAEAYWYNDLMTICSLDGDLKYSLYGTNWNNKNTNEDRYFRDVYFCNKHIIASYLGDNRIEGNNKVNYPTKFIVFDLEGNHVSTLETGYPIITFCCDEDNNRIIMALDDDIQFAYLDLN